jgi:uncharacterized protein YndB with AHSA1/START domain
MVQVQANLKPQAGKAITKRSPFSRETSITINIEAAPSIVWALLTSASDFPRWNSTVVSIKGEIILNRTIELKSTLDEKRVFKLKVKEFLPEKRLVWGDALGNRVYSLEKAGSEVRFTMSEKIGGPLFPLFAGMIPSFDKSFEQFAADLKQEAETIQKSKN